MSPTSFAHRLPECLTTITPLADPNRIEIVHQMHRHDAEKGLAQALNQPDLRLDDLQARAAYALYVEAHFALATSRSPADRLSLTLVGAEIVGDYVLVYQEFLGTLPTTVMVHSDILRDVYPDQVNLVHLKWPRRTKRLVFSNNVRWLTVSNVGDAESARQRKRP